MYAAAPESAPPDLPTIGCGLVAELDTPETAGLTFEFSSGDSPIADAVAALIRR